MYVPFVCDLLDHLDEGAILVGHSSGGMIITEVSRRLGQRVGALVYLSAFLLPPDKTPRDAMKMDTESLLAGCLQIDSLKGLSLVKTECARSLFYEDCSEEDATWAISRLQPEPLIQTGGPVSDAPIVNVSARIPRFYIECLRDKALGPRTQRWMYSESPCDAVYSLTTSHSPFLSAPEALARHLLNIAQIVA
jgi:pimeloyl-ACP methyl ester carboxylesterase